MNFLTPEYDKLIRKEKGLRLVLTFLYMLFCVSAVGAVLLLPSYFVLVLSQDEILRYVEAEEAVLARKQLQEIEKRAGQVSRTLDLYSSNESLRRPLAPLVASLANETPSAIKLSSIELKKNSDESFSFLVRGKAKTRDEFLAYLDRIKRMQEAAAVISPVTNVLKESNLDFSLEIKIKKEVYVSAKK